MKYIIDLDGTLYDSNPLDEQPELINKITLYEGALKFLKKHEIYMITTGNHDLQHKKIDLLGIRKYLKEIIVTNEDKLTPMKKLISNNKLDINDITIIGDRIDREIRAGNTLGCKTIQFKRGKYKVLEPKDALEKPNKIITEFKEIK